MAEHTWHKEVCDLARGAAGGFLFGIPLLYTMEVWWIGSSAHPAQALVALAVAAIVVYGLTMLNGFRGEDKGIPPIRESLSDTVQALALGFLCASAVLLVLQEVTWQTPFSEFVGKAVFEGLPFAFGVALADAQTQPVDNQALEEVEHKHPVLADLTASFTGSVFVAFSIAPTDEVPMLSAPMTPFALGVVVATSLLVSYLIVFVAGFGDQKKRKSSDLILQQPAVETALCYLVSLIAAGGLLLYFGRLDGHDPFTLWITQIVVLGLPATVGGAAGRLFL